MSDHGKPGAPILAGWLWADLLLGLFVIFLAASAAPPRQAAAVSISATQTPQNSPTPQPSPTAKASPTPSRAVSPRSIEVSVSVDEQKLLSKDEAVAGGEQRRIADEVAARLRAAAGQRQVAVALVFAPHPDPEEGDRLARIATAALRSGAFTGALIRPYRSVASGPPGTLRLDLYLYE
jgi:hypothetical protein